MRKPMSTNVFNVNNAVPTVKVKLAGGGCRLMDGVFIVLIGSCSSACVQGEAWKMLQ